MTKLIVSILISLSVATAQGQSNLPCGIVEVPVGVSVVVIDDSGKQVTIQGAETTDQLPIGRYRIESWTMERRDEDGNIWKVIGSTFGKKGVFNVIEGQQIKLPAGEPILSTLAVGRAGSTYQLSHRLTGRMSEVVEITRDGNRPDAPKLHITNADGSYQETLAFEYG